MGQSRGHITATLLAAAVSTPVAGRLGDVYGKRRIPLASLVPLILGSAVCALSSSVIPMIAGRGLQGLGMGVVPLGISLLRDVVPAKKLGPSIAIMSASLGVGGSLGLPLAAASAQNTSWRVLFWVVAVPALAVGALILALVPASTVPVVRPSAPPAMARSISASVPAKFRMEQEGRRTAHSSKKDKKTQVREHLTWVSH
ncbi:hypothetical protein AMK21_11510 [Streptomyces sp. CB00316]|nr:hypothetical protein AMK21_11510 [Streptomyces sp. CB00316]